MSIDYRAVYPSTLVLTDWIVAQQSIQEGGLTIKHLIEEPAEIIAPKLTQHTVVVSLTSKSTRQMTRLGKHEYYGHHPSGSFWLAAATDTQCQWAWDGEDETMLFQIDPQYFQEVAAANGFSAPERLELKNITCGMDPQLLLLAKQYHTEMQQGGLGGQLYSESLGNLFMLHLLRNYCHQSPKNVQVSTGLGDRRLKRVLAYIDAHLDENIGLKELATLAGLSPSHFSEMFKQSLGVPPYRYILSQRIERAKRWLTTSQLPISEISLRCGFADQSHCTKHFRKALGITPSAFRKL